MEERAIDGVGQCGDMHGAEVVVALEESKSWKEVHGHGGTRCNVTNRRTSEEIVKHIPGMDASYIVLFFANLIIVDIIQSSSESRGAIKGRGSRAWRSQ